MTDSSSESEEDLSRFHDAVDVSLLNNAMYSKLNGREDATSTVENEKKLKSNRYLDEASHYNDVVVSEHMKRKIGEKISKLLEKKIKYVDMDHKIKDEELITNSGVKLFHDSPGFLTIESFMDPYNADLHNKIYKYNKRKYSNIQTDKVNLSEVIVDGDFILSGVETKHYKSRRKDKLYKYKGRIDGSKTIMTSIE